MPTDQPAPPGQRPGGDGLEVYECVRCGGEVPLTEAEWDYRNGQPVAGPWCSRDCPGTGGSTRRPAPPAWIKPGVECYYQPSLGIGALYPFTVAGEPRLLGGHTWVVRLEGAGCEYRRAVNDRGGVAAAACDHLLPRAAVDHAAELATEASWLLRNVHLALGGEWAGTPEHQEWYDRRNALLRKIQETTSPTPGGDDNGD